jgi:leucyl aminopeptidase
MAIAVVDVDFSATPSLVRVGGLELAAVDDLPASTSAVAVPVAPDGAVPARLGVPRQRLEACGFRAAVGQTLALPGDDGPVLVAVGVGPSAELDAAGLRDAAAAFARATGDHTHLAVVVDDVVGVASEAAAQAVVEGVVLARYGFEPLRAKPAVTPVAELAIVAGDRPLAALAAGAERGRVFARATSLARDLANTPHSHLTASGMADIAVDLGRAAGLEVEVFDRDDLVAMGCGGLLGVNAGSAEPPRMVRLSYRPSGIAAGRRPTPQLTLVGKGIMYDSGGIALKPGDESHSQMKNDMTGAAAILAAMAALGELECTSAVTGYLMCTDNMPSGTAMALGDVITIRGGTTVEVLNTDAEGRLVMADALVLGTEAPTDAIVDIATLTGACMRALGTHVAGVIGNHAGLVDQVRAAAAATDEAVWELPLERRYRKELDSRVADIRNMGGPNAGAITAALFLAEFVGTVPWAHLDIAGTAQTATDDGWRTAGCSGFGARLLLQLALDFSPPRS